MAEAGRSQQKDKRQVRSRILKDGLKNDSSCLITDGSSTLTASSLETTPVPEYYCYRNRITHELRFASGFGPSRELASRQQGRALDPSCLKLSTSRGSSIGIRSAQSGAVCPKSMISSRTRSCYNNEARKARTTQANAACVR